MVVHECVAVLLQERLQFLIWEWSAVCRVCIPNRGHFEGREGVGVVSPTTYSAVGPGTACVCVCLCVIMQGVIIRYNLIGIILLVQNTGVHLAKIVKGGKS